MADVTKILRDYSEGKITLEEANKKLKEEKSSLTLNPNRNVITPGEEDRFGLLDSGTGSLDKVEIKDGKLVYSVGEMYCLVFFNGKTYHVAEDGVTLID